MKRPPLLLSLLRRLGKLLGHRQRLSEGELPTLPAVPVEAIVVDWTQAPDDAVEWVYDARASRGRWLNGKHQVEEYGIVWEWSPAPAFGATRETRVRKTARDVAEQQAARLARETPSACASSRATRL